MLRTRVVDIAVTTDVVGIVAVIVLLVLVQQTVSELFLAFLLQLLPETFLLLQYMVDRISTLAQQLDVLVTTMDVLLST